MRSLFSAALSLGCLAALVCAGQASHDSMLRKPATAKQPPPGVLHAVLIKGNHLYPAAAIVKETGLRAGGRIDAAGIAAAQKKLEGTELFTNVAYEFRTGTGAAPAYDVTFEVTENEQLFPMHFERLEMKPEAIQSCLRERVPLYLDRIPGTEGVLARYRTAVEECVAPAHPAAKVKATISNDDPQQLTVLFAPDAPPLTISQIFVTGNQVVDTGTILRAVNQVGVGAPLSDMRLKMILDGAIKPLYAAKGYAAVNFPKVDTEPSPNNLGVIVRVQIQEGPLFKFGAIRFHGSGMDQDEIRSTIPFKPGQTFNGEQVSNFRIDMLHKMRRHGLLDAAITSEMTPDDSKRAVDVTYNLAPGATYNFQTLDVQGLDVTTQPAIEKLWGEKQGHAFNPDYPEFFLKRVQEQGIFDNLADVHSDYTADASTHNVTVHLYFQGGKSAAVRSKEKKDKDDQNHSDGSWSPYP